MNQSLRFRIGKHELCESDYRSVLILAKELGGEPEATIAHISMEVSDGRITKLLLMDRISPTWLLTLSDLAGLKDLRFAMFEYAGDCIKLKNLSTLEELHLGVYLDLLPKVHLSRLPNLKTIFLEDIRPLKELEFTDVPKLTTLICRHTGGITKLDLSTCPLLTYLSCEGNEITHLDLSKVPRLERLICGGNKLTHLNLAETPILKSLDCRRNQLDVLDVTMLANLESLSYDSDRTRLLQRPDQKFS